MSEMPETTESKLTNEIMMHVRYVLPYLETSEYNQIFTRVLKILKTKMPPNNIPDDWLNEKGK